MPKKKPKPDLRTRLGVLHRELSGRSSSRGMLRMMADVTGVSPSTVHRWVNSETIGKDTQRSITAGIQKLVAKALVKIDGDQKDAAARRAQIMEVA